MVPMSSWASSADAWSHTRRSAAACAALSVPVRKRCGRLASGSPPLRRSSRPSNNACDSEDRP